MSTESRWPRFVAAAVQAAPAFLDAGRTIDKIAALTREAAGRGARLVAFGESFVPGFPLWNLVLPPIRQHGLFRRLYDAALDVPGPETARLGELARDCGVYLSVGVTERSPVSMGGLYNTNLLFGPDGALLARHRKLVPTWAEKLTWTGGDGSTLAPVDTAIGRIGVLICGENTNPLARYALLAQGEQVHVACYPPAWPFRETAAADDYQRWIELRTCAHAFEGKVHALCVAARLDEEAIQVCAGHDQEAEKILRATPPAVSLIAGPTGRLLTAPLVGEEGIVHAEIDVAEQIEEKLAHDIVGNYQRPDVLRLRLNRGPQGPIEFG